MAPTNNAPAAAAAAWQEVLISTKLLAFAEYKVWMVMSNS
jgi:hypothetical protein